MAENGHPYSVLTEARRVLRDLAEQHSYGSDLTYDHGRVAEAVEQAERAIFHALNIMASYGHDEEAANEIAVMFGEKAAT